MVLPARPNLVGFRGEVVTSVTTPNLIGFYGNDSLANYPRYSSMDIAIATFLDGMPLPPPPAHSALLDELQTFIFLPLHRVGLLQLHKITARV